MRRLGRVGLGVLLAGTAHAQAHAQEEDELRLLFEQTQQVTASRIAEPAPLAPAAVTVITEEEIERSGARDLSDVLRTVPGIELTRDQFGAIQIVSRGLLSPSESNQILLLVDGVPANIPYYGGASLVWDDMALAGVKRIEVVRGPGSALYGASAFAGVIQVITKHGDEASGVKATAGGGSFPAGNASVVAGTTIQGGGSIAFRADVLTSEGPSARVERDAFSDVTGAGGLPISGAPGEVETGKEKIHLGLNAKFGETRFGEVTFAASFLRNERGVWLGNYVNVADRQHYVQTDGYARLAWERAFVRNRLRVNTALTVQQHNEHEEQQVFPQAQFDANGDGDLEDYRSAPPMDIGDLASNSFGFDVNASWNFAERHVLIGGVQYQTVNQTDTYFYENWDDSGITADRVPLPFNTAVSRQITGFFVNDDWTFSPRVGGLYRLRVIAGVRYDYYDDDLFKKEDFGRGPWFDAIAPRAGLVYEAFPGLYAKYLYGRAFRPPSFRELYSDDPNVVVGRPTLEPEIVDFHEVAAGYLKPRFQTQVTLWSGRATDLLVSRNVGTTIEFGNLGRTGTDGIEGEIRVEPKPGMRFFANLTAQRVRILDEDRLQPGVTQIKGNVGTSLDLGKRVRFWTAATIMGARLQPDADLEADDERDVDPYAWLTASVAVRVAKGVSIQATGHNLLGADYRDPFDGTALPDEIPPEERSFWLQARLKF